MTAVPPPGDAAQGLDAHLGLEFVEATPARVVCRLIVDGRHLQLYGIIHGGVHAAAAETAASYGAALSAQVRAPGAQAVGLENHTTFLHAARAPAELRIEATPLHAGRSTQVWEVQISDALSGRTLARSTVRLLVLPPGRM